MPISDRQARDIARIGNLAMRKPTRLPITNARNPTTLMMICLASLWSFLTYQRRYASDNMPA